MKYYCKVKGYFWAGGLGFPWHPVEAPTQEQAVKEFSKGSKVSPSKILCRTVPPKKGRVSDSGGMSYKAPLYRIFDGKRYVRFSGASSKAKADFWAYSLRGAGRSVRITTTRKPKTYYHVYVKVPETKSKKKRRN